MLDFAEFNDACKRLYSSEKFVALLGKVERAISDYSMLSSQKSGVLLGFSGGPDSVFALLCLMALSERYGISVRCIHINHCLRKGDADTDEQLCVSVCKALSVPLTVLRADVGAYAKENKLSTELAAREIRYSAFEKELKATGFNHIAVAHNATDNLETVIFNITRGAGVKGASGIPPVRDSIIRPLIYITKREILSVLDAFGVPYAIDKTNFECDYTRNLIRNKVLPTLLEINCAAEESAIRFGKNLREDADALDRIANGFFAKNYKAGFISRQSLEECHTAIKYRVIKLLGKEASCLERTHIDAILSRLSEKGAFSVSLPRGYEFYADAYKCTVRPTRTASESVSPDSVFLEEGDNYLPEFGAMINLSYERVQINFSNVYNYSIQVAIPFDIIKGKLFVRARKEGDSYSFGGINHKLKKMMIDAKIPKERRSSYPIICDSEGILYVPRFSWRNSRELSPDDKRIYLTVYLNDRI